MKGVLVDVEGKPMPDLAPPPPCPNKKDRPCASIDRGSRAFCYPVSCVVVTFERLFTVNAFLSGLGTSTHEEGKDYFRNIARHRIPFKYGGVEDDRCINLAFSKKKIEERKDWLTNWMESKHRREDYGFDSDAVSFTVISRFCVNWPARKPKVLVLGRKPL